MHTLHFYKIQKVDKTGFFQRPISHYMDIFSSKHVQSFGTILRISMDILRFYVIFFIENDHHSFFA